MRGRGAGRVLLSTRLAVAVWPHRVLQALLDQREERVKTLLPLRQPIPRTAQAQPCLNRRRTSRHHRHHRHPATCRPRLKRKYVSFRRNKTRGNSFNDVCWSTLVRSLPPSVLFAWRRHPTTCGSLGASFKYFYDACDE